MIKYTLAARKGTTLKESIPVTFSRLLWQNNSLQKANVAKLTENISTQKLVTKLSLSAAVYVINRISLLRTTSIATTQHCIAKPVDSIIRKRSNTIMSFPLSHWKLSNHFFDNPAFLANVNFRYLSSPVRLTVVCNVRAPYSAVWNFRQYFTPFGTLAIHWHQGKILQRSSQGNPSVWGG